MPKSQYISPEKAFEKVNKNVKGIITVETNITGQVAEDAALYTKKVLRADIPVYALPFKFGVPAIKDIKAKFKQIVDGEIKEVF